MDQQREAMPHRWRERKKGWRRAERSKNRQAAGKREEGREAAKGHTGERSGRTRERPRPARGLGGGAASKADFKK